MTLAFKNPVFSTRDASGQMSTCRLGTRHHDEFVDTYAFDGDDDPVVTLTDVEGNVLGTATLVDISTCTYDEYRTLWAQDNHDPEARTPEGIDAAMKEAYGRVPASDEVVTDVLFAPTVAEGASEALLDTLDARFVLDRAVGPLMASLPLDRLMYEVDVVVRAAVASARAHLSNGDEGDARESLVGAAATLTAAIERL